MKSMLRAALVGFVVAAVSVGLLAAQGAPTMSGQWTMNGPSIKDHVDFTIHHTGARGRTSSSSPMPLNQLLGLTRIQLDSLGSTVQFDLVRDAGTFQCQGYIEKESGGGVFVFTANPDFVRDMASLGYPNLSDERVFTFTLHDITRDFIRKSRSRFGNLSIDQLLRVKIHGILD
jgi:hypothetical protein